MYDFKEQESQMIDNELKVIFPVFWKIMVTISTADTLHEPYRNFTAEIMYNFAYLYKWTVEAAPSTSKC